MISVRPRYDEYSLASINLSVFETAMLKATPCDSVRAMICYDPSNGMPGDVPPNSVTALYFQGRVYCERLPVTCVGVLHERTTHGIQLDGVKRFAGLTAVRLDQVPLTSILSLGCSAYTKLSKVSQSTRLSPR